MEVQENLGKSLGKKGYSFKIHEFASSTVPLIVLQKEGVTVDVIQSKYIFHTCQCLLPPSPCYVGCESYFGKDPGDYTDELFSRRLICYREIWNKIIEGGYICYSDFVEVFMKHWRERAGRGCMEVKRGPILI